MGARLMGYESAERSQLLAVARQGVERAACAGRMLEIDPAEHPRSLRELRACFVTLRKRGELRGCLGSLQATRPLVVEVAHNAYRSALSDPRFPPVQAPELSQIAVELSVLTPLEPFPVASEQELLAELVPGRDGLVLHEGAAAATFLPSVWEQVASPRDFLCALRRKAGLRADHWSDSIWFERYRAESMDEQETGGA